MDEPQLTHSEPNAAPTRKRVAWLVLLRRVVEFPLTRFVLIVAVAMAVGIPVMMLLNRGFEPLKQVDFFTDRVEGTFLLELTGRIAVTAVLLAAFLLVERIIARRRITELSPQRAGLELAAGGALGVAMVSLAMLVLLVAGFYSVQSWFWTPEGSNFAFSFLLSFLVMVMVAFGEELIFRGILFRLSEELLGSIPAIAVSSALFGWAHAVNPGATIRSTIFIAIEAGFTLATLYMLTRRLWAVTGLHLTWNFFLGSVYGNPVSGHDAFPTIIKAEVAGPELITGGDFGAEAGLSAFVPVTLLGVVLLVLAIRRGEFYLLPPWVCRWLGRPCKPLFEPVTTPGTDLPVSEALQGS